MKRVAIVLLIPLVLTLIVFRKFFFQGQVPIPADILVGAYYPWLDSKWGYPVSVPVKNPLPSDVISIIYPWRIQGISILKSGHLPLWDNTILLGTPLFANFQSALLNPLNSLFFVLPGLLAWSIQIVLQLLLLFGTMFLFLRNLKLGRWASIFGAVLFAFSGYTLVWLEYNTIVYTLVYVPLIFLFVDKLAQTPKIIYSFLIGLALTGQLFSGYPLNTLFTVAFAFVYLLYRMSKVQGGAKLKFLLFSAGVATGLGLASLQLIPGFELTKLSIRDFDHSAQAADIKYLPPLRLIGFFVPDFFGNPATANYWSEGSYDNFAFFLPAAGIFFFIISLLSKIAFKKGNLIFFILAVLSMVYATENFFSNLLANVSFLGLSSSVNTRALFVACFGAATLAAFGFEHTLKSRLSLFQRLVPLVIYFGLIFGSFAGWELNKQYEAGFQAANTQVRNLPIRGGEQLVDEVRDILKDYNRYTNAAMTALRNSVIPFGVVMGCFLLVSLRSRFLLIGFLPLLLLVSIKTSFDKYLSFTHRDLVFPEMPAIRQLSQLSGGHRFEKEKAELLPANTWSAFGLKSASGQNTLAPLTSARYLNLINYGELNDQLLTRFVDVTNSASPLYDTLDIEYYIVLNRSVKLSIPEKGGRPFPWKIPAKFKDVVNIDTVRIYKNEGNLGSAWFSKNVRCLDSQEETVQVLTDKNYNPRDLMLVDCTSSLEDKMLGEVAFVEERPNYYKLQASTPEDNYLILSKAYFPGWKAFIDKQETSIVAANIGLMGIFIPKGEHSVELFYKPSSFKQGVLVSAGMLAIWMVILLYRYRQKFLLKFNFRSRAS